MPKTTTELLIRHILETFVKPEAVTDATDVTTIKQVLEFPVTSMRGVEAIDAHVLNKHFSVERIEDLAELDAHDPFNALVPANITDPAQFAAKKKGLQEEIMEQFSDGFDFNKTAIAARLISNAWHKKKTYEKRKETKILVLGLDNAGKTAILNVLGGKMGYKELKNLTPTKRIERSEIKAKDLSLFLWDFGGQSDYREEYLKRPEKYFVQTDLVLYVIDMQDPDRYNESFEYFHRILDLIKFVGESPYLIVFLHKSDPEYVETPEYQLNLEYVKGRVLAMVRDEFNMEYDIYTTSIYNFFTTEPKFSKFLKTMLSSKSMSDPVLKKVTGLADIVDSTLNAIIQLSSSFVEQFSSLADRVAGMEAWIRNFHAQSQAAATGQRVSQDQARGAPASTPGSNAIQRPPRAPPAAPPPPDPVKAGRQEPNVRATILSELKSLFQKRRALDE